MGRQYINPNKLTPAEHRIITFLVSGNTSRVSIAAAGNTSPRTVSAQLSTMYEKLGCENMTGLFYWALHNGWNVDGSYCAPVEAWIAEFEARLQAMSEELKCLKAQKANV